MPLLPYPIDDKAVAFNQGADARVKGWPVDSNPYDHVHENGKYGSWKSGWTDVHLHYGEWVDGRWPVRKLKPVVGEVAC